MEQRRPKDAPSERLFAYITLLEKTNDELVKNLKHCLTMFESLGPSIPNPRGWEKFLEAFQQTVIAGEQITKNRTLH